MSELHIQQQKWPSDCGDKASDEQRPERSDANVSQDVLGMNLKGILDLSILLERIDNDKDIAKELLTLFLTESAEIINRLKPDTNLENSSDLITREAHRLKGMCQDIGCEHMAELASQLEKMENMSPLPECSALIYRIQIGYRTLRAEVDKAMSEF